MSIWSSFVLYVRSHEFKVNLLLFWSLYRLIFVLETIPVSLIMLWWLIFEEKPIQFQWEFWVQVLAILLQLPLLIMPMGIVFCSPGT